MAARTVKIRQTEETRAKIKTSQLLNRLADHAFGQVELSPTQVRSIEILLRKTLPDLSSVEHSGSIDTRPVQSMTDDELARIAAAGGSSSGTTEAQERPKVLN